MFDVLVDDGVKLYVNDQLLIDKWVTTSAEYTNAIALQAGVPICPVAVRGTDVLRPFSRVDVSIGPPIHPDPPAWWSLSQRVSQVVESVQRAITSGLQRRRVQ